MKNPFTPLGKRGRAKRVDELAAKLRRAGKQAEAVAAYQRAIAIDPSWSVPFLHLGLLHKDAGQWQAALEATQRATELSPQEEAAWWSLGVVATALGRWEVARLAWRSVGLKAPPGAGPIELPQGTAPIRLPGESETVCADRLDPARAKLSGIPRGRFCFGDVVLNDPAPSGYSKVRGQDVPVFDCLALLEPSPLATWSLDITLEEPTRKAEAPGVFGQLAIIARERGIAAENWTTKAADRAPLPLERLARVEPQRIAIAARTRGEVHDLLADWDAEGRGALVGDVQMVFSHA